MDMTSYLLGKKKGGNKGWVEIGYDDEPFAINDAIDYAKNIKSNWVIKTTYASKFADNNYITFMPMVNTSNCTNFSNMFARCPKLLTIPSLDTSKGTDFTQCFINCKGLITIGELDMSNATTIYTLFGNYGAPCLKDLGGFKNLGKSYSVTKNANSTDYNLYLTSSKNLTHESLMNVINKLYDINSIGVKTQSLTLGSTNLAKLTAEEIAIATEKGWNVS